MVIPLIIASTFITTILGGMFALRFKDRLHLVLGFSAGAVIGVAFFDLIPEAIELGGTVHEVSTITSLVALGFVGYMLIDRFVASHHHVDETHEEHTLHARGILGAGSLSVHSFLDGAAIGLAFKVSPTVGAIVASAVLVHDFSDGINTVNMILKNGGTKRQVYKWLFIDAIAPVAGILSTLFITISGPSLGVVLALFAGFFLYIGASDLLPESYHRHPRTLTTIMTLIGMGVLYAVIHMAGHSH